MAFTFDISNKILIMFVACLAFDIMCSTKLLLGTKADLIDDVCGLTKIDPQYCITALRSDPRSSQADLPTLAQIAIDLAQSKTKSTITLVQALEAADPNRTMTYESCLENYNDTSRNLDKCNSDLKKKDYPTLNQDGSAAGDGPDTCDDNFNPPASEPLELRQSSNQTQELCAVICAIANKLS